MCGGGAIVQLRDLRSRLLVSVSKLMAVTTFQCWLRRLAMATRVAPLATRSLPEGAARRPRSTPSVASFRLTACTLTVSSIAPFLKRCVRHARAVACARCRGHVPLQDGTWSWAAWVFLAEGATGKHRTLFYKVCERRSARLLCGGRVRGRTACRVRGTSSGLRRRGLRRTRGGWRFG